MRILRKSESQFGAPVGIYTGVFLGLRDMPNDQSLLGKDGKPMQPGMEWQFRIEEGPYKGRVVSRITSREPTTKNICGRLLDGLVGRTVPTGEDVDDSNYVGKPYQIVVSPNPGNPERTYVTQIIPLAAVGPALPHRRRRSRAGRFGLLRLRAPSRQAWPTTPSRNG